MKIHFSLNIFGQLFQMFSCSLNNLFPFIPLSMQFCRSFTISSSKTSLIHKYPVSCTKSVVYMACGVFRNISPSYMKVGHALFIKSSFCFIGTIFAKCEWKTLELFTIYKYFCFLWKMYNITVGPSNLICIVANPIQCCPGLC